MIIDSVTQLREWGHGIERALNISLSIDHNGVLALGSSAGHLLAVGPIPGQAALIFTGLIGVADNTMRADTLCALLAANLDPRWSGSGSIAAVPQTREIVYRLIWAPDEPHWTESVFRSVLEAFAQHVDALAAAAATPAPASAAPPAATTSPQRLSSRRASERSSCQSAASG